MYIDRNIDKYLLKWGASSDHKPLLVRGARQVGKSTAVRHFGKSFENFAEFNFERNPSLIKLFDDDLDVKVITSQLSALSKTPIVEGKTLLFLDEIQACPNAITSLRFFKEDMPGLHVIAAGSLLEFALAELPTFGVGRIHSLYMYPLSFDEFLNALNYKELLNIRLNASSSNPLSKPLYEKLVALFRTYILVGGMPAAVKKWIETGDYIACAEVQDELVTGYENDFPKYRKKTDPELLRATLRSAALQNSKKFNYSQVGSGYRSEQVKKGVEMLVLAGLLIPVTRTSADGVPLGSGADPSDRKLILLDSGILLRILNMTLGDISAITNEIITGAISELTNIGMLSEMICGLEMIKYSSPNMRKELFYWARYARNSQAEIDYVSNNLFTLIPIEVKANLQGGMKSLWMFMRDRKLRNALRVSLENFGKLEFKDLQDLRDPQPIREVEICPLYAISQMQTIITKMFSNS